MAPSFLATGLFRESLEKALAAAQSIHPFEHVTVSGRLMEDERWSALVSLAAAKFGDVQCVRGLPGSRLKHAAQGAALIADGLAGGQYRDLVEHLAIARASGTVLDGLRYSRSSELRRAFGVDDSS